MRRHIVGPIHIGVLVGVLVGGVGCSSDNGEDDAGTVRPDGGTVLDAGHDAGQDGGVTENLRVQQTVLVVNSADAGFGAGPRMDPNLVNAWGLAAGPQTPFWISDNETGLSSVFDADGNEARAAVTVPGSPTGVAFNADAASFSGDRFLFASEDGTISGWQSGDTAVVRVDNSGSDAVYKGIAIANGTLFATNFSSGQVDMFDSNFAPMGSFTDSNVPAGFAPFNVAFLDNTLFVTFAKQDAMKEDDVEGPGNGFVTAFDASGGSPRRVISNGPLNSPWGLAMAPSDFGGASGMLLVGNFGGDGNINVFDPATGATIGQLQGSDGSPIAIDGLWAIHFGNGAAAGPTNTLFFTAGPNDEADGAFGKLELISP